MSKTGLMVFFFYGLVLLSANAAERPVIDDNATAFSGVFSLNWTAGYCYAMMGTQNECDPKQIALWDSKSFTIHGLWPSSQTKRIYEDFNLSYANSNIRLFAEMYNLWPPQTNYPITDPETASTFNQHWLWEHEWNKHGKDYVNILQVLKPEQYQRSSQKTLQTQYFTDALNLYNLKYKGLQKIRLNPKNNFSKKNGRGFDFILGKQDVARWMGIPQTHFMVICQKDDVLSEVRPCWRFEKTKGIYDLPCSSVQSQTIYPLEDTCPKAFKLLAYGKYGKRHQKNVFRSSSYNKKASRKCKKQCRRRCQSSCQKECPRLA